MNIKIDCWTRNIRIRNKKDRLSVETYFGLASSASDVVVDDIVVVSTQVGFPDNIDVSIVHRSGVGQDVMERRSG